MSTPTDIIEPPTDAAGEVFDPELHASKPNGEPAVKQDGTFRKRRRDAGGGRRTAAAASKPARGRGSSTEGMPKALAEQHARHARSIRDNAAVPLTLLSFASPVDAYCLNELVDPLADAVATYAQENPRVAAMLDRLSGVGGITTVLTIFAMGAVQVAHNHDLVPEHLVRMVGGKPKREVEAILDAQAAQLRGEQAPAVADAA